MAKKKVKLFVSYARANSSLAENLLQRLQEQSAPAKFYSYGYWDDGEILVGENWHEEIRKAIAGCNLSLLLISPAFLASNYIDEHELPKFIGKRAKPVLPIVLRRINIDRHDLKGLQKTQLFGLKGTKVKPFKAFGECTPLQRTRFAENLFDHIEKRLDKLFA
jgi:hypothetical protein